MWYVYAVRCNDGSYYIGITNDIAKRIRKHNKGTASKYTRCRRPVFLIYQLEVDTRSEALKVEARMKKMSHLEKERLEDLGDDGRQDT
jgi:putative endonuclease